MNLQSHFLQLIKDNSIEEVKLLSLSHNPTLDYNRALSAASQLQDLILFDFIIDNNDVKLCPNNSFLLKHFIDIADFIRLNKILSLENNQYSLEHSTIKTVLNYSLKYNTDLFYKIINEKSNFHRVINQAIESDNLFMFKCVTDKYYVDFSEFKHIYNQITHLCCINIINYLIEQPKFHIILNQPCLFLHLCANINTKGYQDLFLKIISHPCINPLIKDGKGIKILIDFKKISLLPKLFTNPNLQYFEINDIASLFEPEDAKLLLLASNINNF